VISDSGLSRGTIGGIPTYIRNLQSSLKGLSSDLEFETQPNGTWDRWLNALPTGLRRLAYLAWTNTVLPRTLRHREAAIVHGLDMVLPLTRPPGCKSVLTAYDLTCFRHPETLPLRFRLLLRMLVPLMARNADHIICISEFTRSEYRTLLGVPDDRMTVVPLAPSFGVDDVDPARSEAVAASVRQTFGIERDYILSVGTLQPRKNLVNLIRAFNALARQPGFDLDLVAVGASGWGTAAIDRERAQSPARERMRFLGTATHADLRALYQAARVFVYPSLYEGFGIPTLEAMAAGVPVITSRCSAMPEIAGDAALLIDPLDPEAIAAAIRRLVDDPDLADALCAKGRERAATFSWERTARETAEVYKELLG
jgi:glycosyltransferase involved in cell wall biosynthesis